MSVALKKVGDWDIQSLADYVSKIVAKESGNVLGKNQASMVTNRLKKRLIDLGDMSPNQYFQHLENNYAREATHLVTILTTHHTFFFREFCHFEYIITNLDTIIENVKKNGSNKIRILSAACSRGQEVYSLAMLFEHHLKNYPGIGFEITGTDIDPESVKIARNGVYPYNEVKSIPQLYLSGNWQRGTGEISRFAKVKEHLKKNCHFDVMNLLSPEKFLNNNKFDIVFCRNVFIYFDHQTIEKIVSKFKNFLNKNAIFITGLSESLKSLDIEKTTYAPSVYCFDRPTITKTIEGAEEKVNKINPPKTSKVLIPKPIKVLAVDDSKSVLKLLGKIFEKDDDFELVGVAENGLEAEAFLKENEVHAMTLDIHMPEMDGVEYLKKNYNSKHPHVLVVSSASREDTRYAQETLKNGACDFVEKPALNNLAERAEEIKNKLKMAFLNSSPVLSSVDKSFQKDFIINSPEKKSRFLVGSMSDKKKIQATVNEFKGDQPSIFIFFEGNSNYLKVIKDELFKNHKNIEVFEENTKVLKNSIYICDFKEHIEKVTKLTNGMKISLSVFGIVSKNVENLLIDLKDGQILIEDTEGINQNIKEIASDIFPWTSFAHLSTEFLAD